MLFQQKKLNIFADISPVTRYLSNISQEEEEKYLKETKKHEFHVFSYLKLIHVDVDEIDLEKLEWDSMKKICTGLVFKSDIKPAAIPEEIPTKNLSSITENPKVSVSQCLSEPPILLDMSILKSINMKSSNSTYPLIQSKNDNSLLEQDLLEMMDLIKTNEDSVDVEKKLKTLLDYTNKKLASSKDIASNMHIMVLYQFLLEYMKKNENNHKPTVNKRLVQPKPTQKKSITPVRGRPLKKIESVSSMGSAKSSKWIGGNKYQAEFEDDDWVSINQEKKKKESRNEQLYKLSYKEKK